MQISLWVTDLVATWLLIFLEILTEQKNFPTVENKTCIFQMWLTCHDFWCYRYYPEHIFLGGHGFSRYIVPVDIHRFFTEVGDSNCFYREKYTIFAYIQMLMKGLLQIYS